MVYPKPLGERERELTWKGTREDGSTFLNFYETEKILGLVQGSNPGHLLGRRVLHPWAPILFLARMDYQRVQFGEVKIRVNGVCSEISFAGCIATNWP